MKLRMDVSLGPGHIVLDGDLAPVPQKRAKPPILAHVCCGQMAGWIKIPLGTEVGHIVLDGVPASLPQKGHRPLNFWPVSLSVVGKWLDGSRCHLVGR